VDNTAGPDVEGEVVGPLEPEAADFAADLDRLAVVEAELSASEAELDALDSSADPPVTE
jgi:hypothetical protein